MGQQIQLTESCNNFEDRYTRGNHIVGVSMWEFEWVTKYRYKMFRKWKYKKLVEACIRRAASLHGIKWIELNVQARTHTRNSRNPDDNVSKSGIALIEGHFFKIVFLAPSKSRFEISRASFVE